MVPVSRFTWYVPLTWLVVSTGSGLGREPSPGDVEELALPTFTERSTDRGQPEEGSLGGELGAAGSGDPRVAAKAEDLHPYIISEALPKVPGKLVSRILSGEYVDMAELLKDNVEAERRRLLSGESRLGQRLGRREVLDFESWLQCFSAYAAVRGQPEEESLGGELGAAGSGDPRVAAKAEDLHPYIISEALPKVPGKLVRRILSGEYVDMAELLKDNVEAERRRLLSGESRAGQRLECREVPDFERWLQCFSAYAAVVCSKYPHKARELWAYQAFMIAEHRKCGGPGWTLYDINSLPL